MTFLISGFRSAQPAHLRPQSRTLDWLCEAHTRAEATRARAESRHFEEHTFRSRVRAALTRFGCGEESIATRGYELDDCDHTRWQDMAIYRLHEDARGAGSSARTSVFEKLADSMFDRVGVSDDEAPSDLLHVTCTGYVSPSPAQKFVARRGWNAQTRVTHVYHMGCYAAFPALRLAAGARAAFAPQGGARRHSQIIHTELCSLHMDAANHTPEQLVIQSLFADGAIGYVVTRDEPAAPSGFELLAIQEAIIEDSATAMTWACSEWGLKMTLARNVPERISAALEPFIGRLLLQAEVPQDSLQEAFFAVHPGGPRILDRVQDLLRIDDTRLAHSRQVLRERGNMSSATLPHIWMALQSDRQVPPGALVVSLAFGPGLTVCGAILRKFTP